MSSSGEQKIRAFIGVPLPEEIIEALVPAIEQLLGTGVRASWTRPESIHVTLVFLGSVTQSQVDVLIPALRQGAENIPAFDTHIRGIGAFPHPRRPSVLWAGASSEDDGWQRLHAEAQKAAGVIGIAPDTRAFHPHATMARVKEQPPPSLQEVLGALANYDAGAFRVERVILFESKLGAGGSRYVPLAEIALA